MEQLQKEETEEAWWREFRTETTQAQALGLGLGLVASPNPILTLTLTLNRALTLAPALTNAGAGVVGFPREAGGGDS